MKTIKKITKICLVLLLIASCTEDDFSTAFIDDIAAPTNVSALVGVTQDNTGLVTITPLGEGVTNFVIAFGDGSGNSDSITPGSNAQHVYTEGTYDLSIIASGLNGLTTTVTQTIVVSFEAPQNLVVTVENDPGISKQVNVTATADFAILFEVDFGDGSDVVQANIGETASHVYQDAGLYTIMVTAMGAAIETTSYTEVDFEVTEIVQPLTSASTPPGRAESDVISIFSDAYTDIGATDFFPNWGQSTTFNLFDLAGDEMLQYTNLNYQGIDFSSTPIDASQMEFLHIDIWTADENDAKISPISPGPNETAYDLDLTAQQWTSFNIPLSFFTDQNPLVDLSSIIQFKFDGAPAGGAIFVDNLYFYKEPSNSMPLIFDDFEGNGNITTWFGDACGMDNNFVNPYQEGINTSSTVLEYNDTGGQYANVRFDTTPNFDLSQNSTFKLKIFVPASSISGSQPNQISLKLQDGTANEPWVLQTEIIKTISLDSWQEVTFDFANDVTAGEPDPTSRTDFNRVVLQVNSENNTDTVIAYIDDFEFGEAGSGGDTPPYATDDFEGNGTITTWFGDACGMDNEFVNPFVDTLNPSATVLEYNDTGGQYANVRFDVTPNFDMVAKSKFTLKIYLDSASISGSQPNQISLKLQDGTANEPWVLQTEIIKTITLDSWQEVTFDFANDVTAGEPNPISRTDFNRVVLQVNSENNTDTVIAYIDDFNYHN